MAPRKRKDNTSDEAQELFNSDDITDIPEGPNISKDLDVPEDTDKKRGNDAADIYSGRKTPTQVMVDQKPPMSKKESTEQLIRAEELAADMVKKKGRYNPYTDNVKARNPIQGSF